MWNWFDSQVTVDLVESKQPQQTPADLEPQPDSLDDQVEKIVDLGDAHLEMIVGRYHLERVVPFPPSGHHDRSDSTLPSFAIRNIEGRIPNFPVALCERPFASVVIRRLWNSRSRHMKRKSNVFSSTRDLQQFVPHRARIERFAFRKKGIQRKMIPSVIGHSHVFGLDKLDDFTTLNELGGLSRGQVNDSRIDHFVSQLPEQVKPIAARSSRQRDALRRPVRTRQVDAKAVAELCPKTGAFQKPRTRTHAT